MRVLKRSLKLVLAAAAVTSLTASGAPAVEPGAPAEPGPAGQPDAAAGPEAAIKPEIYVKPGGAFSGGWAYALNGYDPVSYFTETGPQPGSDLFTWEWKGVLWRFADRDNRDKFIEQPRAFAPQYGGYCAWAAAHGRTAPGDPHVWAIHNGRLYLTLNRGIKRKWDKDRDSLIVRADANWPGVLKE